MTRQQKQSQKIFEKQLIHRCDVFQKLRMRVDGQWRELYVRVEKKVKCRMSTYKSSKENESHTESQQKFFAPYTLYSLPIKIGSDYRVILYAEQDAVGEWINGQFFETTSEPMNPSFLNHHFETPCENMVTTYEVKEIMNAQGDIIVYLDDEE